jgi:hypothetical protein
MRKDIEVITLTSRLQKIHRTTNLETLVTMCFAECENLFDKSRCSERRNLAYVTSAQGHYMCMHLCVSYSEFFERTKFLDQIHVFCCS